MYKLEPVALLWSTLKSLELEQPLSFLKEILNKKALASSRVTKPTL
jgi:hypothetical protein